MTAAPAVEIEEEAPPPAKAVRLVHLRLVELHESADNPRKHFDAAALKELADNIGKVGLLTPLLVRPRPKGGYEIAAGHRRYRAAKLAGLTEVPCIVRAMDDATFLEVLTIDNLQRNDLHALEEAAGFATLMKAAGYDVPKIAQRVGRSIAYVYDRVKLLQLTPALKDLFLAGRFEAGHAIELARLAAADQARALKDGLFVREIGIFQTSTEERGKDPQKAVSVRELRGWVDQHVRFEEQDVDLPQLFPATAEALAEAAEAEETVVHITYNHQLTDDVRDAKEKTYHAMSWKPAGGELRRDPRSYQMLKSKTCEHSVTGVVVAGQDRGQAFTVCVDKAKCRVHWPAPKKKKATSAGGKKPVNWQERQRQQNERWRRENEERAARRKRWQKARPEVFKALAAAVSKLPGRATGLLADTVIDAVLDGNKVSALMVGVKRGTTAEDLVRYTAFVVLAREFGGSYSDGAEAPKRLKPFGIDVKKILDQIAPVEKKAKPAAAAKQKPAKGKKIAEPAVDDDEPFDDLEEDAE